MRSGVTFSLVGVCFCRLAERDFEKVPSAETSPARRSRTGCRLFSSHRARSDSWPLSGPAGTPASEEAVMLAESAKAADSEDTGRFLQPVPG